VSLITLLVFVIVACLAYWAVMRLLGAFGIGDPIATVVQVILVIMLLVALLGQLGYGPGVGLRLR
jgi:hypothetical protein